MSRGRGRGRGRGKPFANMEGIGFAPGEAAPPPILQPPPLFPILERKPLELKIDDDSEYLYSIKQEFQQHMKQSPFYLKAESDKASVERYSDKYQDTKDKQFDEIFPWQIEWSFFPNELQLKKKMKKVKRVSESPKIKPKSKKLGEKRKAKQRQVEPGSESEDDNLVISRKKRKVKVTFADSDQEEDSDIQTLKVKDVDVLKKLKELEKSEASGEEEGSGEENNVLSGDEEYYDEEIEEEGTDYNQTYFDNGEDFIAEDDLEDNEGPYY